jgi:hypothetical protein
VCLVRGCDREEYCRGLCVRHYKQARRLATDEPEAYAVLEKAGAIAPSRREQQNDMRQLAVALMGRKRSK